MNKITDKIFLEYLSLLLVLSFLFLHKILLIIIGISIALYCSTVEVKDQLKTEVRNKRDKQKNNPIEESDINLLEAVEEFGFIPCLSDKDGERSV